MKKSFFGGLVASLLLGGVAFAHGNMKGTDYDTQSQSGTSSDTSTQMKTTTQDTSGMQGSMQGEMIQGKVTGIKKNEVMIDSEKKPLFVDKSATIMKDGKTCALKDLKKGDDIRASYDTRNGKKFATTITVTSMGASGGSMDEGSQSGTSNYNSGSSDINSNSGSSDVKSGSDVNSGSDIKSGSDTNSGSMDTTQPSGTGSDTNSGTMNQGTNSQSGTGDVNQPSDSTQLPKDQTAPVTPNSSDVNSGSNSSSTTNPSSTNY